MKQSKKEPRVTNAISKQRKELEKEAVNIIKRLPDKKIMEIMEALK